MSSIQDLSHFSRYKNMDCTSILADPKTEVDSYQRYHAYIRDVCIEFGCIRVYLSQDMIPEDRKSSHVHLSNWLNDCLLGNHEEYVSPPFGLAPTEYSFMSAYEDGVEKEIKCYIMRLPKLSGSFDEDVFYQENIYLFHRTRDAYALMHYLAQKHLPLLKLDQTRIALYTWINGNWLGPEYSKKTSEFYGMETEFEAIASDHDIVCNRQALANKLGAMSGLNYLLYGEPGTGKTTFVMTVARRLGIKRVYVVKAEDMVDSKVMERCLNPRTDAKRIVIVEDFDRYLQDIGEKKMSALLNSLEGVCDGSGIFRFFSANFPEVVEGSTGALVSRFSRFIEFPLPDVSTITKYLKSVLCGEYEEDESTILEASEDFVAHRRTIRDIQKLLLRHIMDPIPLVGCITELSE